MSLYTDSSSSDDDKYVVSGKEFNKLTKKYKKTRCGFA